MTESLRVELEQFLWRFKDVDRDRGSVFSLKYDQVVKSNAEKSCYELDVTLSQHA